MDKIGSLEMSLLELGAELYRLKERVAHLTESNDEQLRTMGSLKTLLEEKGLITIEDLEMLMTLNRTEEGAEAFDEGEFNKDLMITKREFH